MAATLVLIRHGQSRANADGLFTGLLDASMTDAGREEARHAAILLEDAGLCPPSWFCSPLRRAAETAAILRSHLRPRPVHVEMDWRLAERNYGALTGRSKSEVLEESGEEQYLAWRRSVHTEPPPMSKADFAALGGAPDWLGLTESLSAVIARVGILWRERIEPVLDSGDDVLVVAHGNSLRALCTVLDHLDEEEVRDLNIPTGHPLVYRIGDDGRPVVPGGIYLEAAAAASAAAAIAREGGT